MTPQQLRVRAWKNIASARSLLGSDPDAAAQLIGLAAELALKARYCTRKGWTDFPQSRKAARQRGAPEQLFSHDLEELLRCTDDIAIKTSSMHKVNWLRASDWSIDKRYTPVGTLSSEQVSEQLEATESLFLELVLWEILEKAVVAEKEQAEARGPFNFFALVRDPENGKWTVWFAAWGTDAGVHHRLAATATAVYEGLDGDLATTLGGVRSFHPFMPEIQPFYVLLPTIQHQPRCITSHNVVAGMRSMPPAYIVTCANWSEASVLEDVKQRPQHENEASLPNAAA